MRRLVIEEETSASVSLRTQGLDALGHPEIVVSVDDPTLKQEAEEFLFFVCHNVEQGNKLRPGETMPYGYWLTKFQGRNSTTLETWEYNDEGTEFVTGALRTLRYWRDQHDVCRRVWRRVPAAPP